jgi:hypothetical protein
VQEWNYGGGLPYPIGIAVLLLIVHRKWSFGVGWLNQRCLETLLTGFENYLSTPPFSGVLPVGKGQLQHLPLC